MSNGRAHTLRSTNGIRPAPTVAPRQFAGISIGRPCDLAFGSHQLIEGREAAQRFEVYLSMEAGRRGEAVNETDRDDTRKSLPCLPDGRTLLAQVA